MHTKNIITFKQYCTNIWKNKKNIEYLLNLQNNHNINVIFALWCAWKQEINSLSNTTDIKNCLKLCNDFEKQNILEIRKYRQSLNKQDLIYKETLQKEIDNEFKLISQLEKTSLPTGNVNTVTEFKNITKLDLILQ